MMRAVVNVAFGLRYMRGQDRLKEAMRNQGEAVIAWSGCDRDWPAHALKPYAFKAYALYEAARKAISLLWCDSSIVPIRSLEPIWQRIEKDGYWMSRNGWMNYEWTADSAYPDLFPRLSLDEARLENRQIPHVVATAFGVSTVHDRGRVFLDEYLRLARSNAFCGPWMNLNYPDCPWDPNDRRRGAYHCAPCGPADVRGHRHDQTAASVIASRLNFNLTSPPGIFAYKGGETDDTILMADGTYE